MILSCIIIDIHILATGGLVLPVGVVRSRPSKVARLPV